MALDFCRFLENNLAFLVGDDCCSGRDFLGMVQVPSQCDGVSNTQQDKQSLLLPVRKNRANESYERICSIGFICYCCWWDKGA